MLMTSPRSAMTSPLLARSGGPTSSSTRCSSWSSKYFQHFISHCNRLLNYKTINSIPYIFSAFKAVLRIHDILVWIRIRGSMLLINGSGSGFGSGSCYFRHWPSRRQQKLISKKKFFCLLLFECKFTSFFNDKSLNEVTKQ